MDRYHEIYRAFRWEVPERFNIAEHCCLRWRHDPGRVALLWESDAGETARFTFAEIAVTAQRLSNALAALRVGKGDRVAVLLPQRVEAIISYFAILQMGAIVVPLSHLFGPEAIRQRLVAASPKIVFADIASLPALLQAAPDVPELRQVVGVAGAREAGVMAWESLVENGDARYQRLETSAADPAFLLFTSGTTGPAKGALIPHRALLGNMPGFIHSHDFYPQAGDLFWSPADWAWTGGLMDALLPTLALGQTLLGYCGRFEAKRAFHLLEKYRVRNTFLFPTALKLMMKAVPEPRATTGVRLRSLMSAGEPVGAPLIEWGREQLGVTINEMFGQTEANYVVGNSHTVWPVKPGSIGRPYPGHRVAVIDEAGNVLPPDTIGEIAVYGEGDPVMFLGYLNDPQSTTDKFVNGWAKTGDHGRFDEDGYLWFQGRTDDVIKSSGYRIGPAEIEGCLLRHPLVQNAAVIGKPDAERGQIVKAFIVLQPGIAGSEEVRAAIQNHVRAQLAPYEYPREIEFLEMMPLTPTGKIRRNVLRERGARWADG